MTSQKLPSLKKITPKTWLFVSFPTSASTIAFFVLLSSRVHFSFAHFPLSDLWHAPKLTSTGRNPPRENRGKTHRRRRHDTWSRENLAVRVKGRRVITLCTQFSFIWTANNCRRRLWGGAGNHRIMWCLWEVEFSQGRRTSWTLIEQPLGVMYFSGARVGV